MAPAGHVAGQTDGCVLGQNYMVTEKGELGYYSNGAPEEGLLISRVLFQARFIWEQHAQRRSIVELLRWEDKVGNWRHASIV